MNPYTNYYVNQAGSGLTGFSGIRYQHGHGFFGKFFSTALLPVLKYFGKQALGTGVNVAEDLLDGKNFKDSMKTRAIETCKNVTRAAINRGRSYIQKETGKRRRKSRNPYSKKKVKTNRKRSRSRSRVNFLS